MRYTILAIAAFLGLSSAAGTPCFDFGDCILSGGGQCVVPAGQFIGTCAGTATTTLATVTTTAASTSATGAVCFDAGDCILSGGQCVKATGQFLGNCSK